MKTSGGDITNRELFEAMADILYVIVNNMVAKADLKNVATKSDIKNMATKSDLKAEIESLATKDDLQGMEDRLAGKINNLRIVSA